MPKYQIQGYVRNSQNMQLYRRRKIMDLNHESNSYPLFRTDLDC